MQCNICWYKRVSEKYKSVAVVLQTVMGMVILLVGFYMFWLAF